MFKLSDLDKAKIANIKKLWSGVTNHHLTGEEFNAAVSAQHLETHVMAYSFAETLLNVPINEEDPRHQNYLGLVLAAQQNPASWRQYNHRVQCEILNILSMRYASEERLRQDPIFKIHDVIFDIRNIGDLASVASSFGRGRVKIAGVGARILIGRFVGGSAQNGGVGLDIVENLDKLDSNDILQARIKLNPDALQYVLKKQQNLINDLKSVLASYNIRLEDFSEAQQKQMRQLYAKFIQGDKEARAHIQKMHQENQDERKLQQEKERYYRQMGNATEFFQGLGAIAGLVKDPKLSRNIQAISLVGQQGIKIADKVMELGGMVPGITPPMGLEMLFPMANIAIATASLIFSLTRKRKCQEQSALGEALQTISKQIDELRQGIYKIYERLDLIDEKLERIYREMIEECENIKGIIAFESSELRDTIQVSVGKLQADIDELAEITALGQKALALVSYRDQIFEPIYVYVDGASESVINSTQLSVLEKNWLLGQFCAGLFAGQYFRADQSYHQVAKIANKNVELVLGYLAQFAKTKLGVQGIKDVNLPSFDLWMEGIGLAVAARTRLALKDNKEIPLTNLEALRQKAARTLEFIEAVQSQKEDIFTKLFEQYQGALNKFEEMAVNKMIARGLLKLGGDTVPMSSIHLKAIKPDPTQANLPELDAQYLLKNLKDSNIPSILALAQKWGIGEWVATYVGSKTPGDAGHGKGENWNYPTYRTPAVPIFTITLAFRLNKLIIPILKIKLQEECQTKSWSIVGRKKCTYDGDVLVPAYRAQQAAIPLEDLVTNDRWLKSTVTIDPALDPELQKNVALQGILFPAAVLKKAISLDPENEQRLTAEQEALLEAVKGEKKDAELTIAMNQMQAARVLMLAYAELMGFDVKQRSEIDSTLIANSDRFLENPSLLEKVSAGIPKLKRSLDELPNENESAILFKLRHVHNLIALYIRLRDGIEARRKMPDLSVNGHFIDWSKIEIEKDEKGEIVLGEGGFGKVYKGRRIDKQPPVEVAIKVIKADIGDQLEAFKAEIENLSKLCSPYTVESYGYSKKDDRICLIMELAPNRSLNKLLANNENKLSSEQQILWVMQAARALKYLHGNGIIHGDVKSLNFLLDRNLNIKLNDFGLASMTNEVKLQTATQSCTRAQKHAPDSAEKAMKVFGGSLLWQPPEVVEYNEDLSESSSLEGDIYSLGVAFWEIFARRLPFGPIYKKPDPKKPGEIRLVVNSDIKIRDILLGKATKGEKVRRRQDDDIDPIPATTPSIIKEIIEGCWRRKPGDRPKIGEIIDNLNNAFPHLAKRLDQLEEDFAKEQTEKWAKSASESNMDSEKLYENIAHYCNMFGPGKSGDQSAGSSDSAASSGPRSASASGAAGPSGSFTPHFQNMRGASAQRDKEPTQATNSAAASP